LKKDVLSIAKNPPPSNLNSRNSNNSMNAKKEWTPSRVWTPTTKGTTKMVEIPGTEGMPTTIGMQQKQKGQKQLEC
jgi:hypothetical protein